MIRPTCIAAAALGFTAALLFAPTAYALPIAVANSSFESPVLSDNGVNFFPPGWTAGNEAGIYNPTDAQFAGSSGDAGSNSLPFPALGHQIGFTGGGTAGTLFQEVGFVQANTIYELTVAVGARLDASFPWKAEIILRSQGPNTFTLGVLDINQDGTIPGAGTFEDNTLVVDSSLFPGEVGASLYIVLIDTGVLTQALWDNVRLTAVPEPGSVALLGLGLAGLALRRRRPPRRSRLA